MREAYGEFVAFFFGWAYTVFIVGGGAATIAAAFGDFSCAFFGADGRWAGLFGVAAIAVTTGVNALGLRVGASAQNVLTVLKEAALLAVVVVGFGWGRAPIDLARGAGSYGGWGFWSLFAAGALNALWAYSGSTDSVKMAEEITDVRRALPRALIGAAVSLTAVYVLFNVALMRVLPIEEMAGREFVAGEAMARVFGEPGGRAAADSFSMPEMESRREH